MTNGDKLLKEAKFFTKHLDEIIEKEQLKPRKLRPEIAGMKKKLDDVNYAFEKELAQDKVDQEYLDSMDLEEPMWGTDK